MIKIEPFENTPKHTAQLVDLINYCQNIEAGLNIKMAEQDDIFQIKDYYQRRGGQFWLATDDKQVVGSIALLPIDNHYAVLKKFFTYPDYRGNPHRLGVQLFELLIQFAKNQNFREIVLDTPENEHRSHFFYEKHGFKLISREKLPVSYQFPDRDSRIYLKQL